MECPPLKKEKKKELSANLRDNTYLWSLSKQRVPYVGKARWHIGMSSASGSKGPQFKPR